MITRNEVLYKACDECIKELYSLAQPVVTWEDFLKENKEYFQKEDEWKTWKKEGSHPEWEGKSITECIGPKPFEFYYLPENILNEICDNYIYAYKIDNQQELLNTIDILKNYCKEPIVDKWIERNGNEPGYRGYDRPDNLEKELTNLIPDSGFDKSVTVESVQNKFFEFLDMAGKFYNWNRELNLFKTSIYLGASPSANKQKVIDNWKIYRNQDIEIDESKYTEDNDYDE